MCKCLILAIILKNEFSFHNPHPLKFSWKCQWRNPVGFFAETKTTSTSSVTTSAIKQSAIQQSMSFSYFLDKTFRKYLRPKTSHFLQWLINYRTNVLNLQPPEWEAEPWHCSNKSHQYMYWASLTPYLRISPSFITQVNRIIMWPPLTTTDKNFWGSGLQIQTFETKKSYLGDLWIVL